MIDTFRANLRSANIPAPESDIDRVIAEGYLDRVTAFRETVSTLDRESEPDYLGDWALLPEPRSDADGGEGRITRSQDGGSTAAADWPATIAELAQHIEGGEISPVVLTEKALARIEERDSVLNAFQLVLADQAIDAARRAEDELHRGVYRGPLHGVPVAAKDLLAMSGTVTTAGSKVFAGRVTDFNAAVVERLEAAGAIIVGKTRLSEFAYWPGSTNPHYGPTRNPHGLERDTGGSSSGSGAAVADGIVPAALGSDTGGSIRIPAALCGVVGLKPTFGRVSLFGCTPLAWSLDHLGPLTRTVEDAAILLECIAGHDPRDPRTRRGTAFSSTVDSAAGVAGLRVGVPSILAADTRGEAAHQSWECANRALEDAGAVLVETELPDIEALRRVSGLILAVEASGLHAPLLREHYEDYGEFCKGRLLGAMAFSAEDFLQAQRLRSVLRKRWDALWDKIDLLSTPSQPDVAPLLDEAPSTLFTNPFNALGWPAISVPCGVGENDLPLAVQLVAKPWDEGTLLRCAGAIEDGQ